MDSRKLTRWYDFQARFYARWRNDYDSPLVAAVIARARGLVAPEARILDDGCGTGLFAVALQRALPRARVMGVDLSAGMLAVARDEARSLALCRADATALPFAAGTFDLAVAAGMLAGVNDRTALLAEARRVLRPGGHLLVVEFDRAAMDLRMRLFFHTMILGYRTVSFFFRRFRFAERWDIRASTVDADEVRQWAAAAGLDVLDSTASWGHRIFDLVLQRRSTS